MQDEKMPNIEFEYLREAFNKMSKQVKYLFDYAYDEKIGKERCKNHGASGADQSPFFK